MMTKRELARRNVTIASMVCACCGLTALPTTDVRAITPLTERDIELAEEAAERELAAFDLIVAAERSVQHIGESGPRAALLAGIGTVLNESGKTESGRRNFAKAFEASEHIRFVYARQKAMAKFAAAQWDSGDPAGVPISTAGMKKPVSRQMVLIRLANRALDDGEPKAKVIHLLEASWQSIEQMNKGMDRAHWITNLASYWAKASDNERARELLASARAELIEVGTLPRLAVPIVETYIEIGDYNEAIESLELVFYHREKFDLMLEVARRASADNGWEDFAKELIARAAGEIPEIQREYYLLDLARAYHRIGDADQTRQTLRDAAEIASDRLPPWAGRNASTGDLSFRSIHRIAVAMARMGHTDLARETMDLLEDPDDAPPEFQSSQQSVNQRAWTRIWTSMVRRGEFDQAADIASKAGRDREVAIVTRVRYGNVENPVEQAAAIEARDDRIESLLQLIEYFIEVDDHDSAKRALDHARKDVAASRSSKTKAHRSFEIAESYLSLGMEDAAEDMFRMAYRHRRDARSAGRTRHLINLGRGLHTVGAAEEAATVFEEALASDLHSRAFPGPQEVVRALADIGNASLARESFDVVMETFEEGELQQPTRSVMNQLRRAMLEIGDVRRATRAVLVFEAPELISKGMWEIAMSDTANAEAYAEAMEIAEQADNTQAQAWLRLGKARALLR